MLDGEVFFAPTQTLRGWKEHPFRRLKDRPAREADEVFSAVSPFIDPLADAPDPSFVKSIWTRGDEKLVHGAVVIGA